MFYLFHRQSLRPLFDLKFGGAGSSVKPARQRIPSREHPPHRLQQWLDMFKVIYSRIISCGQWFYFIWWLRLFLNHILWSTFCGGHIYGFFLILEEIIWPALYVGYFFYCINSIYLTIRCRGYHCKF